MSLLDPFSLTGASLAAVGIDLYGVRTWNANKLIVMYGGVALSRFADGSFVVIEPTTEAFKEVVGTMLETDRIYSGVRSYNVSFTLKQTSPSNLALSTFMNLDLYANTGGLPLIIKDLGGLTTLFATYAYIISPPRQEFARGMSSREWKLRTTSKAFSVAGGN